MVEILKTKQWKMLLYQKKFSQSTPGELVLEQEKERLPRECCLSMTRRCQLPELRSVAPTYRLRRPVSIEKVVHYNVQV